MSKVIGIDLGTTNSCVAVLEGGEPVVIPNAEGARTTPSVVGFNKAGERLIGQTAKRQSVSNADRTVASIKTQMGSDYKVTIDDKKYSPQEISAFVLGKLKADADAYLGQKVTKAVITVPAYFSDSQRQATKDAGKIAGLEVLRIINEPTAAAFAYGLNKINEDGAKKTSDQKILVYDLGGGTFDVSILEIGTDEGGATFEVLATRGNNKLGGDDFDHLLIKHLTDEFKKETGIDLNKDKLALQRLKDEAEKCKIELSAQLKATVNIPFISMQDGAPVHMNIDVTRAKFDALTEHLVKETITLAQGTLADAKLKNSDLAKVILVGGSTRIPAVVEAVRKMSGKEPFKGINPDECVALGAAIQAGILNQEFGQSIMVLDVTPLSLGIETLGGVFTKIIDRNSTIPTKGSQVFSTAENNQPGVEIHVLQGERAMSKDNKSLGRFRLEGIRPAPRGVPQIEVTFDIDENGIVSVSAKDKDTGKENKTTITASSNLSEKEIDEAIKNAEKFAEEDNRLKELVSARNNAEMVIESVEKILNEEESASKLDDGEKDRLKEGIEKVKAAKDGEDLDAIRTAVTELGDVMNGLAQKLYAGAEGGCGGDGGHDCGDGGCGGDEGEPEVKVEE